MNKFRDKSYTKVSMIILIDTIEDMVVMVNVLNNIGLERSSYKFHKDNLSDCMLEIQMPYNRYLAMMKLLIQKGYNLRSESKVNIFQRLHKNWVLARALSFSRENNMLLYEIN